MFLGHEVPITITTTLQNFLEGHTDFSKTQQCTTSNCNEACETPFISIHANKPHWIELN